MNPNAGKYTREEVEKMTIFRRYELFGCLEAKDVMPSLLKKSEKKAWFFLKKLLTCIVWAPYIRV